MKHLFTTLLGAITGGLVLLGSAAQAQPTIDGHITASEIATQYTSMGAYTRPHSANTGFGDYGLLHAYVTNDQNNLYIAIRGVMGTTGNAFHIFIDGMRRTGIQAGLPDYRGTGLNNPMVGVAGRFDMETDYALGVKYDTFAGSLRIDHSNHFRGRGDLLAFGSPNTVLQMPTGTSIEAFDNSRLCYADAPSLSASTDQGLEIAVPLNSMEMIAGQTVRVFVAYYNPTSQRYAPDFIPESPGLTTSPTVPLDFTSLPGNQSFTYQMRNTGGNPSTLCVTQAPTTSVSGLCTGDPYFQLLSGNAGNYIYNWTGPNGFFSTDRAPTVQNVPWNMGEYNLYIKAGANCGATALPVQVRASGAVAAPSTSGGSVCGSGTVTLRATGAPAGSTYTFYPSATSVVAITQNTTGIYTTPVLTASATYYVTVTNSSGCESPRTAVTATITTAPTVSVAPSGPLSFCQGQNVTLTASGPAGAAYTWNTGATTPTITVAQSGSYSVTMATAGGCQSVSSPLTTTLNPIPAAPVVTQTLLPNGTVQLSSDAITGNQWYLGGNAIPNATSRTYTVRSSAGNGTYTVTTTSGAGCTSLPSTVQLVTITGTRQPAWAAAVQLVPNPTRAQLRVVLPATAPKATLCILNALGQVVLPATTTQLLDVSTLARGIYAVQVQVGTEVATKRLVLE